MTDIVDGASRTVISNGPENMPGYGYGFGGGAMYGSYADCHTGLDGKDAAFLGSHFNAEANRDLMDAVRTEGRETVKAVADADRHLGIQNERNAAAQALATCNLRADMLMQCCEVKQLIQNEHCQTRNLIQDVEARRVRDDLDQARAEILALKVKFEAPL